MAGIYVHIPFCKSKCYYCDFYSIVLNNSNLSLKHEFLEALIHELELQRSFFSGKRINTVYFGGGTPSLYSSEEINKILDKIFSLYDVVSGAEITIEVNPDDFTPEFAHELKKSTPVNRLSIGVQSFVDEDLKVLGRRHDAKQAEQAVRTAQEIGFENISIDFIYGIPHSLEPAESLNFNLEKFYSLSIPHLSAYTLTIEPDTVFGRKYHIGKLKPISDDLFATLYEFITLSLEQHGYLHYEISNYAKQGFISRHNFSYWTGEPYLGVGPAAHSFNGDYRYWNKPNIKPYLKAISQGKILQEKEQLTEKDRFNEYILTHLRTFLGINPSFLDNEFPQFYSVIRSKLQVFADQGFIYPDKHGNFVLTMKGKLIADNLIAELFI